MIHFSTHKESLAYTVEEAMAHERTVTETRLPGNTFCGGY